MEAPDQVDETEAGDPGSHRRVEGEGLESLDGIWPRVRSQSTVHGAKTRKRPISAQ